MNNDKYTSLYIRDWGTTGNFKEFPYQVNGVNTLPEFDASQNDLDKDSYTNTKGKTIRKRIRQNVKTLDFNVPIMTGKELHDFFNMTSAVWLEVKYFDEEKWGIIRSKMYRSATVKYHKYYIDPVDPNKNEYTNVQFSFIEE